jgi:hypothetical protein
MLLYVLHMSLRDVYCDNMTPAIPEQGMAATFRPLIRLGEPIATAVLIQCAYPKVRRSEASEARPRVMAAFAVDGSLRQREVAICRRPILRIQQDAQGLAAAAPRRTETVTPDLGGAHAVARDVDHVVVRPVIQ